MIRQTGGPEVMELSDAPEPTAGPGELLVQVEVAGLNYIDTYHRKGLYPLPLPFTPGVEGAGTVLAVGGDVSEFAPGDRVAWPLSVGSYAERTVVPTTGAVPIPDGVGFDLAAAAMVQGLTAHYLALDSFPLGPADACLIHAGAGGVGLLLIQVAKKLGAKVYATAGTPEKAALATGAGADHVILYDEVDFVDAVRSIAGVERPLDVVYDGVGQATFSKGLTLLRPRGLMCLFGQASGPVPPVDLQTLNGNGSLYVTRPTLGHYILTRHELLARAGEVLGWIGDGSLEVRIGNRFPLAEVADAHRALEGRATTGKVLLFP
jgi:NADPH2:quinone reductase